MKKNQEKKGEREREEPVVKFPAIFLFSFLRITEIEFEGAKQWPLKPVLVFLSLYLKLGRRRRKQKRIE